MGKSNHPGREPLANKLNEELAGIMADCIVNDKAGVFLRAEASLEKYVRGEEEKMAVRRRAHFLACYGPHA